MSSLRAGLTVCYRWHRFSRTKSTSPRAVVRQTKINFSGYLRPDSVWRNNEYMFPTVAGGDGILQDFIEDPKDVDRLYAVADVDGSNFFHLEADAQCRPCRFVDHNLIWPGEIFEA